MFPSSLNCILHCFIKDSYCDVCYNEIGCFSSARPFSNALRHLPMPPSDIDVKYKLFTNQNPDSPQILTNDADVIRSSNFNGNKDTKFIIHGYKHSTSNPWDINMKDAILERDDVNVILVDWVKGARITNYAQVVANTRVVGALLALLMKTLANETEGNYLRRMHLIGHSLGAHVAGYAGERARGTGRITGLDVASLFFKGTEPIVRLDASDAEFVDVIHTNGRGFGMKSSLGHVDFYVNGGLNQPGCENKYLNMFMQLFYRQYNEIGKAIACSHMRVLKLFIESINSNCQFMSYPCQTCTTCGKGCAVMGYDAQQGNPKGDYFLDTNSNQPFCSEYLQINEEFKP
ncbi:hypothetical protein ACJMK2_042292 [Sinanodonta woodiana]|uniref:Lipase domain-containing protein n=1 Tax=Sinanodonta woodiana TaxID=1069815 RepID=A0ABD3W6U5_SINWO